jgi:hypothetical protein
MAYFNNAFHKCFLGTGTTRDNTSTGAAESTTNPYSTDGFITTSGSPSVVLSEIKDPSTGNGTGYFGFYDKDTFLSVAEGDLTPGECCPLVLASASLKENDKQGPFHGGYRETNKSKYINPKLISKYYKAESCDAQQNIVHVGKTNYSPDTDNCVTAFFCDETYYLRVEVKGSPALRFANHNLYQTLQADGGCCENATPTEVDSTLIMIQWAKGIVENPYFEDFIQPVVFDETGTPWFQDAATAVAYGWPAAAPATPTVPGSAQVWTEYVSPGHNPGDMAGIRLLGAYVDTKFGNCSFQLTDHYEKEPIRILASLVDYNGDPCTFEELCVIEECAPLQGMGFGEQVVRDLIQSEAYLQNFFSTDIRIREITQGDQMLASVDRNALYTRYCILHTVPRFNNPSGTFDNDQYMLDITTSGDNAAFESFMDTWLGNCGNECTSRVDYACTPCVPESVPTAP